MNASSEIAEARATALVLRATAKVVRAEQGLAQVPAQSCRRRSRWHDRAGRPLP